MPKVNSLMGILSTSVLILIGCSTYSSPDWVYNFVVWDDYMYVVSDEYTENVGDMLGEVTKYSDQEAIYDENFSNHYREGTKYYEIKEVSTSEAIAIQEGDSYRIAKREGKYGLE
ncbi:hypothetical protein ACQKOF_02725 [Lysinibacillus sp. NPDC093190]|uniref:hypothetical protein n=1 Tax=Lysinibacillus sp. NPDC093190 TaxID=3390575 RepID=UPI003D02515B